MKKISGFLIAASLLAATTARADIVIGVSAPMTGPAAGVMEISLPGLKQAAEDINAKGGIKGEPIKLEILDDACDPKQAVQVANKLVGMKIVAAISVSCSGAAIAPAPVFEEENIPYLLTLASAPDLTKQGFKTMFRPAAREDQDVAAGANFIAKQYAGKSVAVIDDKSTWGKGVSTLVVQTLKDKGFATVDHFSVNAGDQDFSALISRLKAKNYDVVYPALYMRESGLLVRQFGEQNYKPVIVGSALLGMDDFLVIVGPAKKDVYFTRPRLGPKAAELSAKLKAGDMVGVYNVQTYATLEILSQAIAKAGTKPDELMGALRTTAFDTVLGTLRFNSQGDIDAMTFDMWQHTARKPVHVK